MAMTLEDRDRRRALALAAPALLWTVAFFLVPFGVMAAMSFWRRTDAGIERTWDLGNYQTFLANPAFVEAAVNSLEITVVVTVLSVLLAWPLAWISQDCGASTLYRSRGGAF